MDANGNPVSTTSFTQTTVVSYSTPTGMSTETVQVTLSVGPGKGSREQWNG